MTETEDEAWVPASLARWRERQDSEALGRLLKWQRLRAYATAVRILGHGADAEDTVQEAFLKVLSRQKGFEDIDAFRATVYRAVIQCALDFSRRRGSRQDRERDMGESRRTLAPTPPQAADEAETLRLLREELACLAPEARALLALCFQEGLDLAAASAILEVPRETLRDRLGRNLRALREGLGRRGLVLAVLPLARLFGRGQAVVTPPRLCAMLDSHLPGPPVATVPAAGPLAMDGPTLSEQVELAADQGVLARAAHGWRWASAGVLTALCAGVLAWQGNRGMGQPGPSGPAPQHAREGSSGPPPERALAPPGPDPGGARPSPRGLPRPATQTMTPNLALPAQVRAAAQGAVPGLVPTKVELKAQRQGLVYELEGRVGEKHFEILVSTEGKVLRIEEEQEDDGEEREHHPVLAPKTQEEF